MFFPFVLSVTLLTLCTLFFPKAKVELTHDENIKISPQKAAIYLFLFTLSILAVFGIIPYYIALAIIAVAIFILDKNALKKVDYPLILTFVMFFIFAGNMSRIDVVRNLFSFLLSKNTLVFSALSCQVISNVPSAILLSRFTDNWKSLLLGVNIGGTGTLIASLASLITFSEFSRVEPTGKKKYLGVFTLLNFIFLGILLAFCLFIQKFL